VRAIPANESIISTVWQGESMMDANNQTRFRQLLQTMFMHDETGKLVPSPNYQQDAQTLSALVKTIPRITEITLHMQVARFGGFGVYRASLHDSTGQVQEARDDYVLLGKVHPLITLPFSAISWVAPWPPHRCCGRAA